ncbi:MAG: MFS transporter [Pacificimonas sp.]|nr:MFS transporter [Pacificimonas sp.]
MRWVILALVLLASAISYMLRTNVSVLSESMSTDLALSEVQLGLIFSAFAAGYALFQFPGGLFGDRFGSRHALAIIAIGWAVLTFASGLVPGPATWSVGAIVTMLVVTRFLVGVTHAPIFPIASGRVIALWFPVGKWGLPNGLISTGVTLGAALSAPLMVYLMVTYGWRNALFFTAPLGLVVALLWWIVARDKPAQHPSVTPAEQALIEANKPPERAKSAPGEWKELLKNKDLLLLALSYFCMNYVFYLFFNWFFYFLVEVRGFGNEEAGGLVAALWIIGAVGATLGGLLCDMMIKRLGLRWGPASVAIVGLIACGAFLVAGAISEDAYLAVVLLCICFGFNQITEASYWSAAIAVSGDRAAEGTGIMNTGGNLVGLFGGVMVPFLAAQLGWTLAICTGAIFAVLGAITWMFVRADRPAVAVHRVPA